MPRDEVSRTANVGTVGTNGLKSMEDQRIVLDLVLLYKMLRGSIDLL